MIETDQFKYFDELPVAVFGRMWPNNEIFVFYKENKCE